MLSAWLRILGAGTLFRRVSSQSHKTMGPNPLFMLLSLVVIACLVVALCAPRTAEAVVTEHSQTRAPKKVRWADDVVFNGT